MDMKMFLGVGGGVSGDLVRIGEVAGVGDAVDGPTTDSVSMDMAGEGAELDSTGVALNVGENV